MHDSFNLYSPSVTEHMAVRPLNCGRTRKGRVRNVTLWGNRCHGPDSDTTMVSEQSGSWVTCHEREEWGLWEFSKL